MITRLTALALVLLLVGSFALASIAQAEDDPYGPGLTRGELDEWFRDNFPRETELRDAILGWVDPCSGDDCWINHGKVFLAMNEVDGGDDAGAEAVMGRVFFESRNGHHVTGEQLAGWIDGWLAFHAVEQAAILAAVPTPTPPPTPEPTPRPDPTPWPEPVQTGETFESHPWECDHLGSCSYLYGEPLITCHVMSDGFIECERG